MAASPESERREDKPSAVPSWGEVRPSRECEWVEGDPVTLLVPRFGRGRLGQALARAIRSRPYRVRLDGFGTFVWRRCDGSASVADIAGALRSEFGATAEPVEDRLVLFLKQLARSRFVRLGPKA